MQIPTKVNDEIKYLLEASGFVYNDSLKFEAVHCQPQKGYSLQQNGFYQTYLTSDDVGYCRVTVFPKGKLLIKKLQKTFCEFKFLNYSVIRNYTRLFGR